MKVVVVEVYEGPEDHILQHLDTDGSTFHGGFTCTRGFDGPLTITRKIIEDGDEHFISIADHAWSMQHSVLCRPNLLDCAFHAAGVAMSDSGLFDDAAEGKYKMTESTGCYLLEEI